MELYKKYRPELVSDVVGQPEAVKVLSGWIESGSIPHAIMFGGPSGVGKTTLARCLAKTLGAEDVMSYREMNVAVDRGVAMVEDLIEDVGGNISGGNRVWVLDEIHSLSKPAMNSLLKVLEESPSYAYFIFCTTETSKIIPALLNRCSRVTLKSISGTQIEKLLFEVALKEGKEITDAVAMAIANQADGSARAALVLLEQAFAVDDPDDMLAIVKNSDGPDITNPDMRAFWKVLFSQKQVSWKEVAAEFEKLTESPDTIRRVTLAALGTKLRRFNGAGMPLHKVADMMRIFQFGLEDSGKDGLLLMVFDAWARNASR